MNARSDDGNELDDLLERELRRRVGGLRGPNPEPVQAVYRAAARSGGRTMLSLPSLATAGLAAAALVVGGGSAAAAAATHSANPATWGKTVTEAVTTCKSQLGDGQHGIGQCVSAVAKQHGQAQRAAHQAGAAEAAHPSGTPSPHPTGRPSAHPTPPGHAQGRPTGVPAGPPAGGGTHPTGPPALSPHHEQTP